jgi:uncharacterized repeat protein (TIGR03803 family)
MQTGRSSLRAHSQKARSALAVALAWIAASIATSTAQTPHYTALYNFTGGADGALPYQGVIRDLAGNLYGTTRDGGVIDVGSCGYGCGVVYEIDTAGHESVLHAFTGYPADGQVPYGVMRDLAGNFYGTTQYGGAYGYGVVFKLDSAGAYTVLHSFTGRSDGGGPTAGVVEDLAGNLYGTTPQGGLMSSCEFYGCGVVFKFDPSGHETVLYAFTGGADGSGPQAGVIRDSAGNLYGTTVGGGAAGKGVVFKLDTAGNQTVLYGFTGGTDGSAPQSGLIRDAAGSLYGTTNLGGSGKKGVVYKLDATGAQTVLHSFTGPDGASPYAGVIRDPAGNLYGVTYNGGVCGAGAGCGVVYKLDPAGNETVLHQGSSKGAKPYGGLIFGPAGTLYGTMYTGGTADEGVVFQLTP